MAERIELEGSVIKIEGVFDWQKLYLTIVDWFRKKRYDYYEKKNVMKTQTFGFEMEYVAESEREETAYVRYTIKVALHGFNMENVEVIDKGEKKQMVKSNYIEFRLTPIIDLDWKDKWDDTEFKKKARSFFHDYVIKRKVEEWKDKIYYETYQLQTKIKEVLNLTHKYSAYQNAAKKIINE